MGRLRDTIDTLCAAADKEHDHDSNQDDLAETETRTAAVVGFIQRIADRMWKLFVCFLSVGEETVPPVAGKAGCKQRAAGA